MTGVNKLQECVPPMEECGVSKEQTNVDVPGIAFRTRGRRKRARSDSSGGSCGVPYKVAKVVVGVPLDKEKDSKSIVDDSIDCGICFQPLEVRGVLDCCDHKFCYTCIKKWIARSSSCPHCKRSIECLTQQSKDTQEMEPVPKRILRDTIDAEERFTVEHFIMLPYNPSPQLVYENLGYPNLGLQSRVEPTFMNQDYTFTPPMFQVSSVVSHDYRVQPYPIQGIPNPIGNNTFVPPSYNTVFGVFAEHQLTPTFTSNYPLMTQQQDTHLPFQFAQQPTIRPESSYLVTPGRRLAPSNTRTLCLPYRGYPTSGF